MLYIDYYHDNYAYNGKNMLTDAKEYSTKHTSAAITYNQNGITAVLSATTNPAADVSLQTVSAPSSKIGRKSKPRAVQCADILIQ